MVIGIAAAVLLITLVLVMACAHSVSYEHGFKPQGFKRNMR
jgi:hypothetical protein